MAAAIHASAIDRIVRHASVSSSFSSSSSPSPSLLVPASSASSSLSTLVQELESLSKLAGLVSDKDEERRREFFCLRRYIPFIVKLSSKIGENYLSLLSEEERSKCYDVFFISKFIEGAGPSLLGLNNALKQSGNSFTINYHCNLIQTWFSSGGITNFMRDLMDQSAAGENEEDAEQVLVSLPDRIGNKLDGKVPKFFHPKEYFPFLLTACLRFLEETPIQVGEEDEDSLVALKPCLAFAGSLFGKMAITGQSQLSATWLLRHLVVAEEDKGPEEGSKVSSSIVDEVTAKKRMVEETLSKYNKRRSIIIARNILGNLKSRHLDTFLHHLISSAPSDLVGERPTLGEGRVNSLVVDLVAPMCFEDERVRDLLFRELMINRVSLQRGCKERILLMVLSTDYLEMSRYEGKRSNLYAVTRSLSELFASESYTKTRDEEHQSRVFWLLVRCLHAMGGRAAIEEAQVVTFVLEAIQLRLAGHVDWMRRHGMQLAEQFSIIWNPDNPIKFEEDEASSLPHAQDASEPHQDERKGRNGSISQGQPNDGEVTVEEDKEKKKKTRPKRRRQQTSGRRKWQACQDPDRIILSSASESESEEEGGSDSCTDEEEAGGPAARASHLIDDGDSDSDDGLVPYQVEESELENCFARQAAVEERDVESDLVPLRYGEGRVSLPTNLRQCLRGLTSQNPDEIEAAMFALPELVESSHMLEGEDYAEIARALLRLQDSFVMHDFAGRKRRGLLALSVADPAHVAQVFIKCVWSSNDSVATRVDAIDVLVDAAFQLSSLHKMPEPPQMEEEGDTLPSLGKTRRWSNKSKIKRPRPQENQFGKHAKAFFFGMLSGWNEQTSQRLLHVDMYILGRMISSLGVFIECCGNSPATPMLASGLLDLTSHPSLRQHREAYIRRCVFFALARMLMTIPDELFTHLFADRSLAIQSWYEEALREETDLETVRLVRGGHALLSQKLASSLPKITVLDG